MNTLRSLPKSIIITMLIVISPAIVKSSDKEPVINTLEEDLALFSTKTQNLVATANDIFQRVASSAHSAISYAETLISQKSDELGHAIQSATQNTSVSTLTSLFQKQFSTEWTYAEVFRILLQNEVGLWEMRNLSTFMSQNQALCAKALPAACTFASLLAKRMLALSNTPDHIIGHLDALHAYAQMNGYVTPPAALTEAEQKEKHRIITELLLNLDYLTNRAVIKLYITNIESVRSMLPANITEEVILTQIDKALYEALTNTFTIAELTAVREMSKTNLGQKLKNPKIYEAMYNKIKERFREGAFDANVASIIEPHAQQLSEFIQNTVVSANT